MTDRKITFPPARRVGAFVTRRHVGMMKVTVLTRGYSCAAAGLHSVRTERFCRRIAREQAGGDELRWYGSGYDDLPRECVFIPWQQPGGFNPD